MDRWLPLLAVAAVAAGIMSVAGPGMIAFRILRWWTRRRYRGAKRIQPEELIAWRADPGRVPPVVVDLRSEAEYAMSRIEGAARMTEPAKPGDGGVVLYSATGVRSAALAQRLASEGTSGVMTLDGGFFQWVNENRPFAGSRYVSAPSRLTAWLLRREVRA